MKFLLLVHWSFTTCIVYWGWWRKKVASVLGVNLAPSNKIILRTLSRLGLLTHIPFGEPTALFQTPKFATLRRGKEKGTPGYGGSTLSFSGPK